MSTPPPRQVRGTFDDRTFVVYQACSDAIADAALAAPASLASFEPERTTWLNPSFRWTLHHTRWAAEPGRDRLLAVRITRAGFEQALGDSHLGAATAVAPDDDRRQRPAALPAVRVRWEPERGLRFEALPWRAIRIGLSGPAVGTYAHEWVTEIRDVTATARELGRFVTLGDLLAAYELLPLETAYPLPPEIARTVAASRTHAPREMSRA